MKKSKKSKSKKRRILLISGIFFLIILLISFYKFKQYYNSINKANVSLTKEFEYIYIPTGAKYEDVLEILMSKNMIIDIPSFEWTVEKKNYKNHIYSGRYKISNNISNNDLINLLRSGEQTPVKLIFNNIRTIEQFAGKISEQIEVDSSEIINFLNKKENISKYGFNKATIISMFIPNTYEIYWNISIDKFFDRMAKEYKKFWNSGRRRKAQKLNLSQSEVSTLASIVEEETIKNDEKPRIAGVYINRLKKGMRLQADPTIKFALKDFSLKRILKKHLKIDSEYNTYLNRGLPPGPINIPSISSIDAVLNYENHKYLYFCAKEDFSGYHNFAKSLRQHNANARKYQKSLSKNRIY